MKPEIDLELSIKALEVYNIEPNIIKSMLSNLDKILNQPCQHPFKYVVSRCSGEINHCLKCGKDI